MCTVHYTCVYEIYSTYRTQDFVVKKNRTHFTVCQNWSEVCEPHILRDYRLV